MGKAYANKKPLKERPESDFYPTPKFLTKKLLETSEFKYIKSILRETSEKEKRKLTILEPAYGEGAISQVLKENIEDVEIIEHDIQKDGVDFLNYYPEKPIDLIITNPPFSLFDEFVEKSKQISSIVIFIGKVNFFGAYQREKNGIWKNLKDVLIFNRQVDYRTGDRADGKFYCGNLVTGWFIWDNRWKENFWKTRILNVQDGVISRKKY